MKRFLAVVLTLALVATGLLSALAESAAAPLLAEASDAAGGFDEFVIGATTPLSGMFFTNMWGNNTVDIDVRSLIHGYSPVVWTMQSRFEIDPQVVENLTVGQYEDGNKVYMITLADDLKYNDGTPIKAADYVFSLMLFASPVIRELGGITTNSSHIEGYDEYYAGQTNVFTGLRLISDNTFSVEIKHEFLPFFFEIAMIDAIPYPMRLIAPGSEVADDGEGAYIRNTDPAVAEPQFNAEVLARTILDPDTGYLSQPRVSSGPWMLTGFDWETRIAHFKLNPHYKGYYDGAKPTIDNLVFKPVLPENMIERYASGEIHLLNKVVERNNIDSGFTQLVGSGIAQVRNYPRMGLGFISFATERGPAQFEAVRKAVSYALDKVAFRQKFVGNYGIDTYGYYGIGQWMVQRIMGTLPLQETATDEERAAWEALKVSDLKEVLNPYLQDLEMAERLLVDDGWTLNERGEPFVKGSDQVRYKQVDGQLMGLILKWGKMQDSVAASLLQDMMLEPLSEIGIRVEVTEVPFVQLLQHYYRQVDRTYDMMYLATNFISIFDPYFVFNTADAFQGPQNTTGFRDPELERLALELRQTEPGDELTYCVRWLKFQQYFNEKLPMIPLYTNIYFDFFVPELQNYNPDLMNWPVALLHATLGGSAGTAVETPQEEEIEIVG